MASSSSSAQTVAATRKELRAIRQEVGNQKHHYTSTQSTALSQAIDKANGLYEISKTDSRAGALDANLLNVTSALGAEQASNLDKATPEKFIRKLLARFGYASGKHVKWQEVAQQVEDIYQHVPALTFLLGKFEPPEKKERQERKRKQSGPAEPQETADAVSVQQLQEVAEDKAQVARMKVLLQTITEHVGRAEAEGRARKVNLFHLLLHPTSFSQTVENFFDLAFLIKDGFVRLMPESECAFVTDAKPPTTDEYNAGLLRTQNILALDHATYLKLVDRWCTVPPLLPSRAARGDGESGGARTARGGGEAAAAAASSSAADASVSVADDVESSSGAHATGKKRAKPS